MGVSDRGIYFMSCIQIWLFLMGKKIAFVEGFSK